MSRALASCATSAISAGSRVATDPIWLFRPTVAGTASIAARNRVRLTAGGRSMRSGSGPVQAVVRPLDCIGMCSVISWPRAAPAATWPTRLCANGNHDSVNGPGMAITRSVAGCITPRSSITMVMAGFSGCWGRATAKRCQRGWAGVAGTVGVAMTGAGAGAGEGMGGSDGGAISSVTGTELACNAPDIAPARAGMAARPASAAAEEVSRERRWRPVILSSFSVATQSDCNIIAI